MTDMARAIVSLGSNIEPRAEYLARALALLCGLPETRLVKASVIEETDPVDVPGEFADMRFLNQVAIFETGLEVHDFSARMHAIEDMLGRVRTVRNGPRTIDVDLIDFDGMSIDEPDLTLPHPRVAERDFVMRPLAELGVTGLGKKVVILAAGDFPKRGRMAWKLLTEADFVVCCDSAAIAFRRRMSREPDVVVGDCDSIKGSFKNVVRIPEQETNDLEKAVRYCRSRGWKNPVILGATGRREDHTLGNIFRAMALGLEIVTNFGRFVPFSGRRVFAVKKGAVVSIFATDPATRMVSKGLEWPLDDVRFSNLYCATLNRATQDEVVIEADRPSCVYFAE